MKLNKLVIKDWGHVFPGLFSGGGMEWGVCGLVRVKCVLMLAVLIGVSMVKSPYIASGSEIFPSCPSTLLLDT